MMTQLPIDTMTENLASELNLHGYDHTVLAEIVQSRIEELVKDMTQYPSKYFSADILAEAKATPC